jgi:pheromone shutdown protein TraB
MSKDHPDKKDSGYKIPHKKMTDERRRELEAQHWSWIKYIVICAFTGGAIGVITVWLILTFDIGELGGMVARSSHRLAVTALLAAGFASTFGMIAMGVGIMIRSNMSGEKDE